MFGQVILPIPSHSWDDLKMVWKNDYNGLTLRISRWYKWLRFKDIVQGFGKLKKMVEKKQNEI